MKPYAAILIFPIALLALLKPMERAEAGPLVSSGSAIALVASCGSDQYTLGLLDFNGRLTVEMRTSGDNPVAIGYYTVSKMAHPPRGSEMAYLGDAASANLFNLRVGSARPDQLRDATMSVRLKDGTILSDIKIQCRFTQDMTSP